MIYEITVPSFIRGLKNMNHILDKAAQNADAKKVEFEVLMNSRLIADQFPFTRQIQIMCDTAKFHCSRLTGKDAPSHKDDEKSLNDLRARIKSTIQFLEGFSAKDFEGAETKRITTPRWEGKWLNGAEYTLHHSLPNFYFHMTTAYAILRHNGIDIGKKDYLGEMPFKS